MKRKMVIAGSIFIWGLAFLFGIGQLLAQAAGLEYRAFALLAGKAVLFLGIPFWLLMLIWYGLDKSQWRKWKVLGMAALVLVFSGWSFVCVMEIVFTTASEYTLVGKYLVADQENTFLESPIWGTYESVAVFFRREIPYEQDMERLYLEKKYRETFERASMTAEMQAFFHREDMQQTKGLWISEKRPQVPVYVLLNGNVLEDNYAEMLSDYYLYQMAEEKALVTELNYDNNLKRWCFSIEGASLEKATEELFAALSRAAADPFFERNRGAIMLCSEIEGETYYEQLPFGVLSQWDKEGAQYYAELDALLPVVTQKWENMVQQARSHAQYQEQAEKYAQEDALNTQEIQTEQTAVETKPAEQNAKQEDIYTRYGRQIYEKVLFPKEIGKQFEICQSAKGNAYYDLGEDGAFEYTLCYDRESRNEECMLYVLYRAPFDVQTNGYVNYTDSACQIMDIYAVRIKDGTIIASGRTRWEDVGSKEYREATGEPSE